MIRLACCSIALAVLLVVGACNSSSSPHQEKTYPVSGTVTLDGKPLPDGEINFLSPKMGTIDIAQIVDGKFQGEAKAGDRRVEIKAYEEKQPTAGEPSMPGADEVQRINYIDARYNTNSTLKATVTEAGPNEFTFELTSK